MLRDDDVVLIISNAPDLLLAKRSRTCWSKTAWRPA